MKNSKPLVRYLLSMETLRYERRCTGGVSLRELVYMSQVHNLTCLIAYLLISVLALELVPGIEGRSSKAKVVDSAPTVVSRLIFFPELTT